MEERLSFQLEGNPFPEIQIISLKSFQTPEQLNSKKRIIGSHKLKEPSYWEIRFPFTILLVQNFVLCELFTVYFSPWQVYSDLNPLGLQALNLFTPFSVLCLKEEIILVASYFSGVGLCNRIEKKQKTKRKQNSRKASS